MALLKGLKSNRMALLKKFLIDRELVNLIACTDTHELPALDLRYKNVFPYLFTNETVEDKRVFLRFTLTAKAQSPTIVKFYLHIQIFMHKDLILLPGDDGLRTDAMCARVEEMLNGNENLGVTDVELISMNEMVGLPSEFTGCYLQYSVKDINRLCRMS